MVGPSLVGKVLILLSTSQLGLSSTLRDQEQQVVFGPPSSGSKNSNNGIVPGSKHESNIYPLIGHVGPDAVLAALEAHDDPVDAFVALHPAAAAHLAEPRLLHVFGEPEPQWLTEGDKLRLRRQRKKFMDVTDHHEQGGLKTKVAGKANLPPLRHQHLVKPLFAYVSTKRMREALTTLTSFYNRWFGGVPGERSAAWLHSEVASIIDSAPFHTHLSLEYFTHRFPQPSIIARFEPSVRNWSLPLTIVGAHQDSANYFFPLLPAPGADDDGSGSITILESFRVLCQAGYTPLHGPVEFHWYAAEEAGLWGSQAVARYKKDSRANIGAMIEFDMTAFVARNSTEEIAFIKTQADAPLTDWAVGLSKSYSSIDTGVYELHGGGSDYMSFTQNGFPAAFASEGNPSAVGGRYGNYDPYIHTANDTLDIDDETGVFSFDHMARFAELAIAFVVEQAGWDNAWR